MKNRLILLLAAALPALLPAQDFVRDVQPILQRSCYQCHAGKAQMASLRLDAKTMAFKGGVSGPSIVAGKSADSPLYQRIAGIGDQARMPMGGKPLAAAEIAAIEKWIDNGAVWPDEASAQTAEIKKHWAFVPPERPALPDVKESAWVRNPIDRFILSHLETEGVAHSPEADRTTLLRRLSLDLIGLPPTVAELDAFLADKSPGAYEKQVDRLLASPHYGERWGRHWLDAARYADSDGFEKDKPRQMWFYRDWVIKALNRDLPYDQFVIQQIAGDLLPNATQDQIVATGFLRNSMVNEEGGIDPEQFRMEAMYDRMDAIGKGILGVTIQCAQCHNHKFDPLTQEEYYRLFAFLNNSYEALQAVYTPQDLERRAAIYRGTQELENRLKHQMPDWDTRMAAWEAKAANGQPVWTVVQPEVDDNSTGGQKFVARNDGSMIAGGYAPTKSSPKMTLKTDLKDVGSIRLELLNDKDLPFNGPGRSIYGTGALTEFTAEVLPQGSTGKPVKLKFARASADINLAERPLQAPFLEKDPAKDKRITGPIAFAIDGDDNTAWSIETGPGRRNVPRKAVFNLDQPLHSNTGFVFAIYVNQKHGGWNSDDNQNNNLGRMRLSFTPGTDAVADPIPAAVRNVLSIPAAQRTPEQQQAVFSYWRTTVPEWKAVNSEIDALWRTYPEGTSQLVLARRPEPRTTNILFRGDFLKPGKQVYPGVPSFLNQIPQDAPANRLTFAKWLVDRRSPTTARSMVNRIWQEYFGTGIVATSENLGKQCEPPSHPKLLDWLAVEFMDHGWSLKHMHRLIVTSAAYRQSSHVSPEMYSKDPYNRLLARASRIRVDGEIVRDIALSASGLLNEKIGGPSVYPPAPAFLFQPPVSYGPKVWPEAKGPDRYRRSFYTFHFRSVPYPVLQAFDAPSADASCVRRSRSNTPLQALTALNEPMFLELARALAQRAVTDGGPSDGARLRYAFRRTLSRAPSQQESSELLALLDRQTKRFSAPGKNPWELAANDPARPPALPNGVTPARMAGWTAVARVLLNLDETITKE